MLKLTIKVIYILGKFMGESNCNIIAAKFAFDGLSLKRFSSCQAPKKEDDIDVVDSGARVIDGELEVKNIAITFHYDHKKLRFLTSSQQHVAGLSLRFQVAG